MANNKETALVKAIMRQLMNTPEFHESLNLLTGVILHEAEKLRGPSLSFQESMHPDVHNVLVEGAEEAVKLVVENWDAPSFDD